MLSSFALMVDRAVDSVTTDEPTQRFDGTATETGDFRINTEHPPL